MHLAVFEHGSSDVGSNFSPNCATATYVLFQIMSSLAFESLR